MFGKHLQRKIIAVREFMWYHIVNLLKMKCTTDINSGLEKENEFQNCYS